VRPLLYTIHLGQIVFQWARRAGSWGVKGWSVGVIGPYEFPLGRPKPDTAWTATPSLSGPTLSG
jgi:hypothetical protein